MGFVSNYKNRISGPVEAWMKEGAKPDKLSLTIVLGLMMGVIPMLGVNTAACLLLAIIFRLNVVIVQLINYMAFPLQVLLFVPFFKTGEYFFGKSEEKLLQNTFSNLFSNNWFQSLTIIIHANFRAVLVWLILMIPISFLSYFLLKAMFMRLELRRQKVSG